MAVATRNLPSEYASAKPSVGSFSSA
ncbi:hypothetical protein A2U01_0062884, partial [Trifolium medium]|nr:hypothetical protein [Trifolium medium]